MTCRCCVCGWERTIPGHKDDAYQAASDTSFGTWISFFSSFCHLVSPKVRASGKSLEVRLGQGRNKGQRAREAPSMAPGTYTWDHSCLKFTGN